MSDGFYTCTRCPNRLVEGEQEVCGPCLDADAAEPDIDAQIKDEDLTD
jgi:hypothetical protein